ncbi:Bardet-Biedl syndrome 1 protein homolog [Microplitis mediator]|uniref:Bardet-Biedl syndrome 1 protein homolog n=1 Tax=Microplitis mediator TaxID=375433 RepID=UPI00255343F7|nr:Bardet-Biedl syndrome 1 protein homolog [Microplitis mediator]
MERAISSKLSSSRWLEAVWEPSAKLNVLPGGLEMMDVAGDGEARLIAIDLGDELADDAKVRVFKGSDQVQEYSMLHPPCGVVGFYTENNEPKSAVVAVASCTDIFFYKNMKPHFKYSLPFLDAHPKEKEIWHKAGVEQEVNIKVLYEDLELLVKELGSSFISPRTLKFLSLDENLRYEFADLYRSVPLNRPDCATTIGTIRKDSWNDPASSCLVIGTEEGFILILDPRSFHLAEKFQLGWAPVTTVSAGLWSGEGQIFVVSREFEIGTLRKGCGTIKLWEDLAAPAVAMSILPGDGLAVVIMTGIVIGFTGKGQKLWEIKLPGLALDMISIPVQQSGLSLLAVSVPKTGVVIYDSQHHVDTITTFEPISAMKFGRMGQEERALAMVTINGGLCVKILKRTANFSTRSSTTSASNTTETPHTKFSIPKKSRLFVEQTMRERQEAKKIYQSFEQSFLRLQLAVEKRAHEVIFSNTDSINNPITMEISVLGLGPTYVIRTLVASMAEETNEAGLFLVFRANETTFKPRVVDLPLLPPGIPMPAMVKATPRSAISEKVKVLLCRKGKMQPITSAIVMIPIAEPDIEV